MTTTGFLLLALFGAYACHRLGWIELDFPLRRFLRWRRGPWPLPAHDKRGLFSLAAQGEAVRLTARYALGDWPVVSSRDGYAASLFYLALLEHAFSQANLKLPRCVRAVDVGVNDWFYVRPLHAFLMDGGREVSLDGIEIDAYRICPDRYTTIDHAEAHIGSLPNCRYLVCDALNYHEAVDIALMFFPFIFREDHRQWGLPRAQLNPARLLLHVYHLLKPGGILIIVNQGEAERDEQRRLLETNGLAITLQTSFESPLYNFDARRYVTVVRQSSRVL